MNSVIYGSENYTSYLTVVTLVSSSVGIGLSIFAFTLLILTAVIFAEWRQNHKNQLIIQFTLARLLYTFMRYMYDIKNVYRLCDFNCLVYIDVIGLMYSECALVSWMFVFSKHMNDSLVKVFNIQKTSMWKISVITWSAPGVVSSLLYVLYIQRNDRELFYFLLYLFLLKWPLLCANAIFLIQALMAILSTNQSRTEYNMRIIIVMIVLIFVFSFQQILVDSYKIVHLLLIDDCRRFFLTAINIFTIYQCAFSITFWVFGNANTRKMWRYRNTKLTTQLSIRSN